MTIHTGASATPVVDATAGPAGYAAAVRKHLGDLPEETTEDLTDGLEADLAEQAAEHGVDDLTVLLGPADDYAAELRTSAGLPTGGHRRDQMPDLLAKACASARNLPGRWNDSLTRLPWWPPLERAVVSLRPAWWLVRAWIATACIARIQDFTGHRLTLFLVLAVVSVALGQGWLRDHRAVRAVITAGNVLAVLAGLFMTAAGSIVPTRTEAAFAEGTGVYVDDQRATNLFVYDSKGKPVPGARLYDQQGRPVTMDAEQNAAMTAPAPNPIIDYSTGSQIFAFRDANGRSQWNAFPLYSSQPGPEGDSTVSESSDGDVPVTPTPPFSQVPPVTAPTTHPSRSSATAPLRSATPRVSGGLTVGATLRAAAGKWSPTPQFTYQWSRGGTAIPGATRSAYRLTAADQGHSISVTVTGTLRGHTTTSATSSPTGGVR